VKGAGFIASRAGVELVDEWIDWGPWRTHSESSRLPGEEIAFSTKAAAKRRAQPRKRTHLLISVIQTPLPRNPVGAPSKAKEGPTSSSAHTSQASAHRRDMIDIRVPSSTLLTQHDWGPSLQAHIAGVSCPSLRSYSCVDPDSCGGFKGIVIISVAAAHRPYVADWR
jgi:hypothetical protein